MKTTATTTKTTTPANLNTSSANIPSTKKQWAKPEIVLINSGDVETGHSYFIHESATNSGGPFYHS
ncbi:MAG TPA: hypothetical protein VIM89_13175 [Mucilaginibacter sp.]